MGRCGDRATSTDLAASVVSGMQTTQTGTSTGATQMGPTSRSGLPWLATDNESGTEPEDIHSQGGRPDPLKTGWERVVRGAVGGVRHLVPPHAALAEETECWEERITDHSRPRKYSVYAEA